MKYDYVFFDMDGTLADNGVFHSLVLQAFFKRWLNTEMPCAHIREALGSYTTVQEVLVALGIREKELSAVSASLKRFYQTEADEYIKEICVSSYAIDVLKTLEAAGIGMALITNTLHELSVRIIQALHMDSYFYTIRGSEEDQPDLIGRIKFILETEKIEPQKALYVGNLEHDVKTAHLLGCDACLVNTKPNGPNDLKTPRTTPYPKYVISDIRELIGIVMDNYKE